MAKSDNKRKAYQATVTVTMEDETFGRQTVGPARAYVEIDERLFQAILEIADESASRFKGVESTPCNLDNVWRRKALVRVIEAQMHITLNAEYGPPDPSVSLDRLVRIRPKTKTKGRQLYAAKSR
jgi:hypothetical protein